jgi:pSer/pThr/pTyr-binding forkhead associated (FHA) protein
MTLDAAYQILRVLLSLVLYGFLCLVIWIIWQDVKSTRALISLSQSGKSILIDINTTHHHDVTPITSLGRAPTNIIVLQDTTVSMAHALITHRIALWWLEDLGSRNGTYLNDQLVTTPTIISSGDTIAIGSYTFTFKG